MALSTCLGPGPEPPHCCRGRGGACWVRSPYSCCSPGPRPRQAGGLTSVPSLPGPLAAHCCASSPTSTAPSALRGLGRTSCFVPTSFIVSQDSGLGTGVLCHADSTAPLPSSPGLGHPAVTLDPSASRAGASLSPRGPWHPGTLCHAALAEQGTSPHLRVLHPAPSGVPEEPEPRPELS